MVSLPSDLYKGDPLDDVNSALERQSQRQRDAFDGAAETVTSTGQSFGEMGGALSQGDGLAAMNRAGEGILNFATGGEAHEFRDEYRAENPVDDYRESAVDSLDEGGFWGKAGAANEILKTGIDTGVDSPRGFNLQETTVSGLSSLSGVDSDDELASASQDRYDQWMSARSKPAEILGIEDSTTANVAGTGFDWFVQMPAEAVYTTATGVDPASGETNARGEPIDLLDVALLGGGKAIKGIGRGANALRGVGKSDETLRGLSVSRPDAESTSGLTAALGGAAAAAAGVIGGPRAANSMLPGLKGVGQTLRRGSNVADDVAPQVGRSVNNRSIGVSEDALQSRGLDEALQAFDGTPRAGATPSSGAVNIDNVVGNMGGGVDDALSGVDDAVAGGSAQRLSNRIGDTLENFRTQIGANSVDDLAEQTARRAGSSADELGANAGSRLLGSVGQTVDDVSNAARRGLDDAQTSIARTFDESSEAASRAGTSLEDGLDAARLGDEGASLPSRAWTRASNWFENASTSTRFMVKGAAGVLGLSALNDITGFGDWVSETFLSGGAGPTSSPDGLDGSMDHPSEVEQGEAFTADWTVGATGEEAHSGTITLAMEIDGQLQPLAEGTSFSVAQQNSQSGTFEVPSGWGGVEPGRYNTYAVIEMGGEVAGSVDDSALKVTEATGDTEQDGDWSDPEIVRELNYGWYLLSQARVNADEMRFLVAGNREDETTIYLHPDGQGRTEAHTFPTVERAAGAYQKWVKRHEAGSTRDGETPSPGAGRPSPDQVKEDAAASDEGVSGLLNRTIAFARRNPLMFAGMSAATLVAGYYLYTNGYLNPVKKQVERLPFV